MLQPINQKQRVREKRKKNCEKSHNTSNILAFIGITDWQSKVCGGHIRTAGRSVMEKKALAGNINRITTLGETIRDLTG